MSEIRATTISDSAGTGPITLTGQSAAKAWLFYNGTGNAIRDSYNVASVTDNGAGDFTKNMTSAFSSANYSTIGGSGTAASDYRLVTPNFNAAPTTTATRMRVHYASTTPTDDAYISSTSHGDLA